MKPKETSSANYEIRVAGSLPPQWGDWFDDLVLNTENGETLLRGPLADQAALYGLLKKIRDIGLPLVSVRQIPSQEKKMNTNNKTAEMKDRKAILSTLWIFATLNYVYADVFTLFFNSTAQKETLAMPQGAALVFAILMETAIAMVLLSRVLKYGANRWANIAAGIFHTAFVAWSLTGETPELFYVFFAGIEIVCTLFITWYAWKWTNPEVSLENKVR